MTQGIQSPERRREVSRRQSSDGHKVLDMVTNHEGWKVLQERLERHIRSVRDEVEKGKLCHDDYRSYTGELKGLLFIQREVEKLIGQADGGPENAGN